jgi:WD40 repeat protein
MEPEPDAYDSQEQTQELMHRRLSESESSAVVTLHQSVRSFGGGLMIATWGPSSPFVLKSTDTDLVIIDLHIHLSPEAASVRSVVFTPDDQYLLVTLDNSNVYVWDTSSRLLVVRPRMPSQQHVDEQARSTQSSARRSETQESRTCQIS